MVDNTDDVIDVRDVTERVEKLERLEQPGPVDLGSDDNDLFAELRVLRGLLGDLRGYGGDHQWRGDWYPVTLIRDGYFEEYARQLAWETGAIRDDERWPYSCIDWEKAARELKIDYSSVEFGGETYWYR